MIQSFIAMETTPWNELIRIVIDFLIKCNTRVVQLTPTFAALSAKSNETAEKWNKPTEILERLSFIVLKMEWKAKTFFFIKQSGSDWIENKKIHQIF